MMGRLSKHTVTLTKDYAPKQGRGCWTVAGTVEVEACNQWEAENLVEWWLILGDMKSMDERIAWEATPDDNWEFADWSFGVERTEKHWQMS